MAKEAWFIVRNQDGLLCVCRDSEFDESRDTEVSGPYESYLMACVIRDDMKLMAKEKREKG